MERALATPQLGATPKEKGVRFAVYAPHAEEILLCLEGRRIPLNRRGDIWELEVEDVVGEVPYTYVVDGASGLLDPCAKAFTQSPSWIREGPFQGKCLANPTSRFDWEGVDSPDRPLSELILYELHVRAFTASAPLSHPGTYLGLIEAIPHLKKLGINAVELLPIYEYDPCSYKAHNPETGERLKNFWGYGSLGFLAPMSGFASRNPILEFKTLVRELHRTGIEVILDVVYNHTGEGPLLLSDAHYIKQGGRHTNYSGCGNTLSPNTSPTQELILASLRYWAEEMHVDGFRFDLASILTRGPEGEIQSDPPLLRAIREDPLLSSKKLIAEAWDCAGAYQLGEFPNWGPWAEWNGSFRDTVRRFVKGGDGLAGSFASALTGSPQIYAAHKPTCSINFITAHDGFSLQDLVSYNTKHNTANGEENRDGSDHNESWNCGVEGPTTDPDILSLRARQKRNLFLALLIAQGVPMLQMGDEVSHTKQGNNNTWCQDNSLNYFPWEHQDHDLFRFVQGLIAFRKGHPDLKRTKFLSEEEITWYDPTLEVPHWSGRFVAFTVGEIYVAFNAHHEKQKIRLPQGRRWLRIADTALLPPFDYSEKEEAFPLDPAHPYMMESYSALLLIALR